MPVTTETVWREFGDKLRAFLRRRVPDDAAADDILQDVFLRVHTRLGTLRDARRLAPWLYAITRNALADHYRRPRHAPLPEELPAEEESAGRAEAEQLAAYLRRLLSCLPESYRRAMELYELEGLTQVEIARRLGLSVSGAKSRVQRGRRMLKDALLDCCHLEFDRAGYVVASERRRACCRRHDICASRR